MQPVSRSNYHSARFPLHYQWNPDWAREQQQQQHHHQFSKYKQTHPQKSFNENYWCETCDRGFATQDLLHKHNQHHQKCNIDGCQFIAHPKVITKHIQMQHSTGLFKKIANLNNPEDIQKWITERKKRYPTKTNVEKKAAERQEKIERGEKIGLQHKSRNNKNNFRNGTDRKTILFDGRKKFDKKNNNVQHQNAKINKTSLKNYSAPNKEPKKVCQETEDNERRKLKHFTGIRNIIMDSDNEEDSEHGPYLSDDEEEFKETMVIEPKVCDALSTLISNYDNSSEEEDTIKELNATTKMECKDPEKQKIPLDNKNNKSNESIQDNNGCSDDDSGPEEIKKGTIETVIPELRNSSKREKIQRNKKIRNDKNLKTNISKQKVKPKLPSTLLQKLLHREIQQERNIVLQCVNYIVRHNFFDDPQ